MKTLSKTDPFQDRRAILPLDPHMLIQVLGATALRKILDCCEDCAREEIELVRASIKLPEGFKIIKLFLNSDHMLPSLLVESDRLPQHSLGRDYPRLWLRFYYDTGTGLKPENRIIGLYYLDYATQKTVTVWEDPSGTEEGK